MINNTAPVAPLIPLLEGLSSHDGENPTYYDGITVFRTSAPPPPEPVLYTPSIVITAQGKKHIYTGAHAYSYGPDTYLMAISQIPMLCEVTMEAHKPVLVLRVDIDLPLLHELVMEMENILPEYKPTPLSHGICTGALTPELVSTTLRLLKSLQDEGTSRILTRPLVRELYFHILKGPNSNALRRLAHDPRQTRINNVVRHIAINFAEPLRVDDLANMASMSISTFHQNFRAITSVSPLQYIKNIRLTKARFLMLNEGMNAGQAANFVGYESASQFSREYRRFFGTSPARQIHNLVQESGPLSTKK